MLELAGVVGVFALFAILFKCVDGFELPESKRTLLPRLTTKTVGASEPPIPSRAKLYANVGREHRECGDEDAPEYRPGRRDRAHSVMVELFGGPCDGEVLHFARSRGPEIVVPRLVPPKAGASRTEHYGYLDEDPATGIRRYRYTGPDLWLADDVPER